MKIVLCGVNTTRGTLLKGHSVGRLRTTEYWHLISSGGGEVEFSMI